jgi:uncharacterized protein YlxW (UPF0749 family)
MVAVDRSQTGDVVVDSVPVTGSGFTVTICMALAVPHDVATV